MVAAGQAEATLSLSPKNEWDIAAAALILEEAGGLVTDHEGEPFRYNRPEPQVRSVIGAVPRVHHAIIERTNRIAI